MTLTDATLPTSHRLAVRRWSAQGVADVQDHVASEVPVALVFNGISHTVMMATPNDLHDFALGFGLSEGLLDKPDELYDVEVRETPQGLELHLDVAAACEWRLKERRRTLAGRTGCGLCGADSLAQVQRSLPAVAPLHVPARVVLQAEQQLRSWQTLQQLTGATHAAAWVGLDGQIQTVREDVGRHNALDKLIGALVQAHVSPSAGWLLITSRASFEMVQKAVSFGAGVLAAVSAPTALAVEVAKQSNLAMAGYVRGGQLVAYTHAERFEEQ